MDAAAKMLVFFRPYLSAKYPKMKENIVPIMFQSETMVEPKTLSSILHLKLVLLWVAQSWHWLDMLLMVWLLVRSTQTIFGSASKNTVEKTVIALIIDTTPITINEHF
ncbi:hypothetical protein BpHYR1_054524 [Brachionus plicatilis]|uniref:Uncharacterized protein n=1 Tax=Brachionus plicatilis TaxID=10195 RepID=A0A3M7S2S6_BRAPC|nr:hypothetical protein BpHYR1_054524 [Brachionus plicatilis]